MSPRGELAIRELFWNNVIREMLTALSVVPRGPDGAPGIFDGRLAVLTARGERIPIAEVAPVFACGIPGTPQDKALSIAVQCTVFQIRTPPGEVFTLPLHEIRGFVSLTEDLVRQLVEAARAGQGPDDSAESPFGFAAFTSLARGSEAEDSAAGGPQGPDLAGS